MIKLILFAIGIGTLGAIIFPFFGKNEEPGTILFWAFLLTFVAGAIICIWNTKRETKIKALKTFGLLIIGVIVLFQFVGQKGLNESSFRPFN